MVTLKTGLQPRSIVSSTFQTIWQTLPSGFNLIDWVYYICEQHLGYKPHALFGIHTHGDVQQYTLPSQ